jgi:peptide-methionine (R)-S-oxide reductase
MAETELPTESELRDRLTPLQFEVTQRAGTEGAFTGVYHDDKTPGTYNCIVCGLDLFRSDVKYDSRSGWPSFWAPIADDRVSVKTDSSLGMVRTEVNCSRCDAHLGHLFDDGPKPTGQRFCMNSASLDLDAD